MAFLKLTNLLRLRSYLAGQGTDPLEDEIVNNRLLIDQISTVSQTIEEWLNRQMFIEERTEYFDVDYGKKEYWPASAPVISITSVYEDNSGRWDGSESEITSSERFIGSDSRSVVLDQPRSWVKERGLRIIYTGGLAYHGTQSVFTMASVTGTPTAGQYVLNAGEDACGIITAWDSVNSRLTVDNYYGIFAVSDVLTEYNNDTADKTAGDFSGTISVVYRQSLVEAYPSITKASEMQIRYDWRHSNDFENAGTSKDGTTRMAVAEVMSELRPEVIKKLRPFRRDF